MNATLLIFVGNVLIASRNKMNQSRKTRIQVEAKSFTRYFCIEIQLDNDSVFISQAAYTYKIIPIIWHQEIESDCSNTDFNPSESVGTLGVQCYEAVRNLIFSTKTVRPDFLYTIVKVSPFMKNSKTNYGITVKLIFCFIEEIKEFELMYPIFKKWRIIGRLLQL